MVHFVIDNGTHTVKYNWSNLDPIVQPNTLYKIKNTFSFQSSKESYIKRAFIPGHNLIMNYDVLEGTIDNCFNDAGVTNEDFDLILTLGCTTPKIIKKDILELLMEVYRIRKLQLGIDSVYSWLRNTKTKNKNTIILSCSHSETHIIKINDNLRVNQLPYGSERARGYINLLNNKHKESKNFKIKVPVHSYRETCDRVLSNMKKGILTDLEFQTETDSIKNKNCDENEHAKSGKTEESIYEEFVEKNSVQNIDEEKSSEKNEKIENFSDQDENSISEQLQQEEQENNSKSSQVTDEIQADDKPSLDQEKRNKMIYFSSIYRFKMKIEKTLSEMRSGTENLENEYFKTTQPEKYLRKKKEKFYLLKLSIEKRENLKRRLNDKKSRESVIYNRIYNFHENIESLTDDEIEIVNMIEKLNELERDEIYLNNILHEILEMDPTYTDHYTIFEILDGCSLEKSYCNGFLENFSVFRAGEAIFNPSVMGSGMPGLSEMIESEINDFNKLFISSVEDNQSKSESNDSDSNKISYYVVDDSDDEIEINKISSSDTLNLVREISEERKNINFFITGGFSQINGFFERVQNEVQICSYQNMQIDCYSAKDPILDAFYGAEFCKYFPIIDRKEYQEKGTEFFYSK